MKKPILTFCLVSVTIAFLFICGCDRLFVASKKPFGKNVILVSLDAVRADELGCYGSSLGLTPGLDTFASKATLFENGFAVAPWTLPSHASMLTGLYPQSHRAVDIMTPIYGGAFYLPEYLKNNGYTTAGFVTCPFVGREYGFARGMDLFERHKDKEAKKMIGRAMDWMQEQKKPFFCFVHLFTAHQPFTPPRKYFKAYAPDCNPEIGRGYSQKAAFSKIPRHQKCVRQLYRAEIAYTDSLVRKMMRSLIKVNQGEETLVIIVADHGEAFGDHGVVGHAQSLYQDTLAVPFMISGKGIPRGQRISSPVSHVDLVPTILSQLGLEKPAGLQGIDLFDEKALLARSTVFSSVAKNSIAAAAAFDGTHKYFQSPKILLGDSRPEARLYNLKEDPEEQKNIVSSHEPIADGLLAKIESQPDIAKRPLYHVRFLAGEKLDAATVIARCDGPIAGCSLINYHLDREDSLAGWSTRSNFIMTDDSCRAEFSKKRSPDGMVISPMEADTKCTVQVTSAKIPPEKMALRLRLPGDQKVKMPEVVFPLGGLMPKKQKPGTVALGESDGITMAYPFVPGKSGQTVTLDESARESLRSLGYIQ